MKTTICHWCDEIARIVEEYGVKELQNVLPLIVDSLFELHIQVSGGIPWLYVSLSRGFPLLSRLAGVYER